MTEFTTAEYEDLPTDQQQHLVTASISLMRAITEVYGPDRGMAMWDTISNALGTGIKGEIFFGIISGKYTNGKVTVTKSSAQNFVQMIKVIRKHTGMGLKEAKDFCDNVRYSGPHSLDINNSTNANKLLYDLRACGCEAT